MMEKLFPSHKELKLETKTKKRSENKYYPISIHAIFKKANILSMLVNTLNSDYFGADKIYVGGERKRMPKDPCVHRGSRSCNFILPHVFTQIESFSKINAFPSWCPVKYFNTENIVFS